MEKIEYRYRFWYRPKFMVSDWYRIEPKKAGIAHHYYMSTTFCPLGKIYFPMKFLVYINYDGSGEP